MGDMKAGPKLDIDVAEKIMGYRWMRWHDLDYKSPYGPLRRTLCCPSERWLIPPDYVECDLSVPRQRRLQAHYYGPKFSTSIADAFAVVEKMNADRCWVEIHNDPSGTWTVAFGSYAPHTGKSLPETICLAALSSVGQGKQD